MAIEKIIIDNPDDPRITDIARQRHTDEGIDESRAANGLVTAILSGRRVTALREINTNAFLELTVGGDKWIDKLPTASS